MNAFASKRSSFSKVLMPAVACCLLIVGLLSCRERSGIPGNPSTTAIRIPVLASSALQTLDPIKSVELVQYNLDLQIFECLISVGPQGDILPALAESWKPSSDFKVWTFRLREARFSDDPCFPQGKGRSVTVDDVLYSWKRGLNPKAGSLNSWALSTAVAGADAYSKGETTDVAGLQKLSDRELRVELNEPDRDFLTRLTVLSTAIVVREAVEHYGNQFDSHPVGTGPFKLAKWEPGEYVELERNPDYGHGQGWQPEPPKIKRARFIFFRSETQVANAFEDGSVDVRNVTGADFVGLSNLADLDQLQARHPKDKLIRPGSVCSLHLLAPTIGLDFAFGSSASFRRALAAGFDHQRLMDSAVGPLGQMTKSILPPKGILVDGLLPEPPRAVPPPASKAEVSLKSKTVKVAYVSSRINDIVVTLLQDWIKQHGGEVRLFPSASINALFASVGEIKPDLTLIYWSPYYPNTANFLTALLSSSRPVPNFTGFTNAALDQAAKRVKVAGGEEGVNVRQTIKSILDKEMPWIPLYYETPLVLTKSHVQNFQISPVSVIVLTGVELAGAQADGKGAR